MNSTMQSSMADYAPAALTCLIEGESSLLRVKPTTDIDIVDLKDLIHEKGINATEHAVLAKDLILWKVDLEAQPKNELKGLIGKDVKGSAELLEELQKISHYWPANDRPDPGHIHIIVQLPPVPGYGSPTLVNVVGDNSVNSDFVREFQDIFINVKEWGVFDVSDISRNSLRMYVDGEVPDFVAKFEGELNSKPCLASDAHDVFKSIRDIQFVDTYFGPLNVEDGSPEEFISESESRRHADHLEVTHLAYIACGGAWEFFWKGGLGKTLKEPSMNAAFFYYFALITLQTSGSITVLTSQHSWPFNLIVKRAIRNENEELRKFRPRSDLLVSKFTLPRLLVEVNSKPKKDWPEDLVRMLLTGAAVVRFANRHLNGFMADKNFVLLAIYIWDNGEVYCYSLFQVSNNPEVRYHKTSYLLNTSVGRAKFVRQLYNLRHMLERDEEDEDTEAKMNLLRNKIERHDNEYPMNWFNTKETNNRNKRKRTDRDVSDKGTGGGGGAGSVGGTDCAELETHGYEVEPQDIVDESGFVIQAFFKMPPHILTVYQRSAPSKRFIAKKVHGGSNELEIFKLLNTFQLKSEHIISLHESFQTQSTSWVVLPKMTSLTRSQLYGEVAQVCWGLINGVAYLHTYRIAHRDIKPENLVVDGDFCLKIIDFDVAMQVKGEDEVVEGQCGTKGWMAPEMEKKSMYSPIKADRWSTGQVILYLLDKFRKEDTVLRATARKLTAHNPEQRSSMLQVAASLSDVAKVAVERKALQSLQDAVEVDGENAELPRVKKQKISVPEGVGLGVFYQPEPHQPVVRVQ